MNKKIIIIYGVAIVIAIVIGFIFFLNKNELTSQTPVASSTQAIDGFSGATSTTTSTSPIHPHVNTYAINLPNALILVDAQGRRTGKDPLTGIFYHEIPNTQYEEGSASGQLTFTSPTNGQYTLYILGGTTGQYHLDSWVDDGGSKVPVPQRISGTLQEGSMVIYAQNYNTADISDSNVLLSGTASSTASITTAPAKNLPPPPLH